jgi:PHP family Zn ribbon phosphoesterase
MDLHVHTCLSPCADNTMAPPAIARAALRAGLQAIGICDHNSAGNVAAVQSAGRRQGLAVLAGMEVASREEIHLLAFFELLDQLLDFDGLVAAHLNGRNAPLQFGDQILTDERGEPVELEERLLVGATELGVADLVQAVHQRHGVAIASHIDKEAFSIIGQLGFIPADLDLDAVELSPHAGAEDDFRKHGYPIIRSSDAHFLEEIGRASSVFHVAKPSVSELSKALHGVEGRRIAG